MNSLSTLANAGGGGSNSSINNTSSQLSADNNENQASGGGGGGGSLNSNSSNTNSVSSGGNGGAGSTSPTACPAHQINRETRIGATYAYVELANLFGTQWLEHHLKLYLTHVLNLVNGQARSVLTHLDAVCSRKCVQFILRSVLGGMLNEKVQIQAARDLLHIIQKCLNSSDLLSEDKRGLNQQQVLICALYELSFIVKNLNTSASILVGVEDQKLVERIFAALMYPNSAVKCASAWCLRTIASALPAMMTPLLDMCMDRLSLIRQPSDALVGYGYACAALLGAVNECPLGVPNLMPKLAFNIGEELLRTANQSTNLSLAEQKTSIGWLLLGAFMIMGSSLVRKHLSRLKKLWTLTFPSSLEQLEAEKKRGDSQTWQLSLESRTGALATMHSFLVNCAELVGGVEGDFNFTNLTLHFNFIFFFTHAHTHIFLKTLITIRDFNLTMKSSLK